MHQVYLPDTRHLIDIGPNWIHGTNNNPILNLAEETDTRTHSWGEKSHMYTEDGQHITNYLTKELNAIMWEIIADAFSYSKTFNAVIPSEESLYDWFAKRIKFAIPETVDHFEEKRKLVLQASEMWGCFVGSPITRQSGKFFWLEECIDGGMSFSFVNVVCQLFCAEHLQKTSSWRVHTPKSLSA